MQTMTAGEIHRMLNCVRAIEDMTEPMRQGEIKAPVAGKLYPAVAAAAEIREMLLRYSLADIEVV